MSDHVVQFDSGGDTSRSVSAACDALARGKIVGLPTETAYVPCVLPQFAALLQSLSHEDEKQRLVTLLDEPATFLDAFGPRAGRVRRLARRGWPGPIVIEVPLAAESRSRLASTKLQPVTDDTKLLVTLPVSRAIEEVTDRLGQPLVALMSFSTPMAVSATQVVERWAERAELIVDAGPPRFAAPPTLVGVESDSLRVLAQGIVGAEMVHRMSAEVFLFVCTGNTCRSPMAEGLFRHLMAQKLHCAQEELIPSGVLALSAGLAAAHGMPASEESVSLLKERGIDLGGHSSQPVTRELLQHSDHVFTMTGRHREQILRVYPELADQVQMLSPEGVDIVDPIGGSWEDYAECLRQIEDALKHRLRTDTRREDQ